MTVSDIVMYRFVPRYTNYSWTRGIYEQPIAITQSSNMFRVASLECFYMLAMWNKILTNLLLIWCNMVKKITVFPVAAFTVEHTIVNMSEYDEIRQGVEEVFLTM